MDRLATAARDHCRSPTQRAQVDTRDLTDNNQDGHVSHERSGAISWRTEEWKPSLRVSIVWNVLGLMLVVAGLVGFWRIASFLSDGVAGFAGLDSMLMAGIIRVSVLIVHELMHGAGMLAFGARPGFGAALVQKVMPVVYCTAPGHWFTRRQFLVVALAPVVGISAFGIALMPFGNLAEWMIVPLALNLGGAIGDIWFVGLLMRRTPDTMIEDLKDGLRFHYPVYPQIASAKDAGSPDSLPASRQESC